MSSEDFPTSCSSSNSHINGLLDACKNNLNRAFPDVAHNPNYLVKDLFKAIALLDKEFSRPNNQNDFKAIYIGSFYVSSDAICIGSLIAKARTKIYLLNNQKNKYSFEENAIGAIGEWVIMDSIKNHNKIVAPNLLSCKGVDEPDLKFSHYPSITFDIKTTNFKNSNFYIYKSIDSNNLRSNSHIIRGVYDCNTKLIDYYLIHKKYLVSNNDIQIYLNKNKTKYIQYLKKNGRIHNIQSTVDNKNFLVKVAVNLKDFILL